MSDLRHNHIINAVGLTRSELIRVLLLASKQWSDANILRISELNLEDRDQQIAFSERICPSDAMNSIMRKLSELPQLVQKPAKEPSSH